MSGALQWSLLLAWNIGRAVAGNTRLCIRNTGGTCTTEACASWRGPTTCDRGTGTGRCFCTPGFCSGTDEKCYNGTNLYQQIGGTYNIRNARWPAQYMWVRDDGAVLTSSDKSDKSGFTIVVPPSTTGSTRPATLLYSQRWDDSTVRIAMADKKYSVRCDRVAGNLGGLAADPSISTLGLRLWRAPLTGENNVTLVMFSGYSFSDQYVYVANAGLSIGGWAVNAYRNDPGAGGYWLFEPQLPRSFLDALPVYDGPRCSWFCGTASVGKAERPQYVIGLCLVLLAILLDQ